MYTEIKRLIQEYGADGEIEDMRVLHAYMDAEPRDRVAQLRLELNGVVQGRAKLETLEQIVGQKRRLRYGNYQEWGRMCLLWMSSHTD